MAGSTSEMTGPSDLSGALTEVLPTRRVAFGKQMDIIRAYGALGAASMQAVTMQQVADVVGLKPDTAALTNSFFQSVGLISKSESGRMKPAPEVIEFHKAYQWSPETAGGELGPLFEESWFWGALAGHLAMNPITDAKAIAILGQASNAMKNRAAELNLILDFLEAADLIEHADGHVRLPRSTRERGAPQSADVPEPELLPTPRQSPAYQHDDLPLLIQGLIEQIPQGNWSRDQADQWLALADMTFNVVYGLPPKGAGGTRRSSGGDPAGE